MTYTLKIWYAATPEDDEPQTHTGLTKEQVWQYVTPDVGFMHDMLSLEGRGVRRLCLEVEDANVARRIA